MMWAGRLSATDPLPSTGPRLDPPNR